MRTNTMKARSVSFINKVEVKLWLGCVSAVFLFQILIFPSLMIPTTVLSNFSLLGRFWQIWVSSADDGHYFAIAQNWYRNESFVFFPLWPVFMRILGTSPVTALAGAILLTLLFLVLFKELVRVYRQNHAVEQILMSVTAFLIQSYALIRFLNFEMVA